MTIALPDNPVILGLETSCDETAAAVVVDGREVRSNVISSQIALHQSHGGVVPELAARGQITAISPVVDAALREAEVSPSDLDAIAVTQGPGLAGSLLVGLNAAKALAMGWKLPLIPVNHLEAHVYASWLQQPDADAIEPAFPSVALLVSGGHTALILMKSHSEGKLLGQTIDDAAGEAFDKGARLLGLGYPGGPAIQRAAEGGDRNTIPLPRAWLDRSLDFSFSGLKTSLLRHAQPWRLPDPPRELPPGTIFPPHQPPVFKDDFPVADFAASFEEAIVDVLTIKAVWALERTGARSVVIAGGVAANRALRERLRAMVAETFGERHPTVSWPDLSFCTDNAAMIAGLARWREPLTGGAAWSLDAYPNLAFGEKRG
ncbi:MAG TPA: tRNA (adenosine(37)-N6)-threonylcarbamoyltransferase complex transferase subunit TsaD [Thermomicrobiales bacterium]|nr:tRNA (adenosine(37)-N6)-threonylcarbamoyltransferase complex transferase subunit TsaD [Thermomicrobiales bacterium]